MQDKASQANPSQAKPSQAKSRQDKTRQDKTRQDKTRQDKSAHKQTQTNSHKPMENVAGDWSFVGGTSRPVKIRQGQTDTDTHRLTQAETNTDRQDKTRQE